MTLLGGAELERALQWIIRHSSSFAIYDQAENKTLDIDVASFLENSRYYSSHKIWSKNPAAFFEKSNEIPQVESKLVHGLKDGSIIDLQFESAYESQNENCPEFNRLYPENSQVHARYWQHTENAKATIVALHGWTMGDQRLNSLAFLPGYFYKMGFDVVLMELPFHGRRRPKSLTQQEADSLFPGSDLALTNEVIGQFIHDMRRLKLFLNQYGNQRTGCVGMSLGAYFAALWSSLDRLDFCIPIVPVVSMSDLAWNALKAAPNFYQLKVQGMSKKVIEEGFSLHSPLTHSLQCESDRVLILAGLADNVVPSSQPRSLWRHWGKPQMHRFRGGHMAQFKDKRAISRIVKFLNELPLE